MIAQIGPLVRAGERYRVAVGHVVGGVAGGFTAGVVVGLVSVLLHVVTWPPVALPIVLAIVLLLAACADAGFLRLPYFGTTRQTTSTWRCAFGPPLGVLAWGFDLGMALTTRMTSYTMLALPAYALLSGDF